MKPTKPQPHWRIFRIKSTPAHEIGTVTAPDAEAAIAKAIGEYRITEPHKQQRLVARRIG